MILTIKLSGEGLSGDGNKFGHSRLHMISDQIRILLDQGHQIGIVIGGGNIFRGKDLSGNLGVERTTADYIGMLATVQNALVLRDYFESREIESRVLSAVSMPQICESFIPKRANRHLEKGRVVIFAAGLGAPYFTTDTCAVQRSLEIGAKILIMAKNGVEGIYTADPKKDLSARFIKDITCTEILEQGLAVADAAAIGLAKENKLHIKIVSVEKISEALLLEVGSSIIPR
ncbi:MAG: UMP kinase [Candidatus Vogelbacteria bacterium]|nr:UMP kinase [Candidatus Vogelbacteria bacterium]